MIIISTKVLPSTIIVPRQLSSTYKYYSILLRNTVTAQEYRVDPITFTELKDYYRITIDLGFLPDGEYVITITGDIVNTLYTGLLRIGKIDLQRDNTFTEYKDKIEYTTYENRE